MARRAGLLVMLLGLLGTVAVGAELRNVPSGPDAQVLAVFVAAWLAMGIGGLLMWRRKARTAMVFLVAGVVLFAMDPLVCLLVGAFDALVAVIVMGVPPLLLLVCALAIMLRREPAPDYLSEGDKT